MPPTIEATVERQDGDTSGRYVIPLADGFEAEMTYRKPRSGVIAIDHTFVPPEFRGKGLADSLVAAAIADARSEPFKIVPLCSYVALQFRRHKEWADLLAA